MKRMNYLDGRPKTKRVLSGIILLFFWASTSCSQDVIFLKDGNEIKSKILEITDNIIKYQNYNDQNAVPLTVLKSDVFMVKYENGIREVFQSQPPVQPSPQPAARPSPADAKFDPDTSDFARKRRKKFSGPRVGFTVITPGTSVDYLEKRGKRPLITQFGWQFEARLFTVEETSGIIEFVPMIGGLEQGMFIPSASALLGVRTGDRFIFEFAVGPNFSVVPDYYGNKKGFAGLVLAAGTSFRKGNIFFPITFAFVPSVGNVTTVYDPVTQTSSEVTYHTGHRISLILGFNSRKK